MSTITFRQVGENIYNGYDESRQIVGVVAFRPPESIKEYGYWEAATKSHKKISVRNPETKKMETHNGFVIENWIRFNSKEEAERHIQEVA